MGDFGGLSPPSSTLFRLDKFITAFSKEEERKSTLLSEKEECYNPILAFSFFYHFQIHWFDKYIPVIHAKMDVIEGVAHIVPTSQPPLLQF